MTRTPEYKAAAGSSKQSSSSSSVTPTQASQRSALGVSSPAQANSLCTIGSDVSGVKRESGLIFR